MTGAVAGEIVGKGVEAHIDINEVADLKGGKVAVAIEVGKELGKFVTSKLTEKHVKEHQNSDVKKDGSTDHHKDQKE